MTDLTPAAMAHAIGAAEPVMDGLGHGRITEPPPSGLSYVLLVGGPVAHADIGLDRRVVDRRLDARFGSGRPRPASTMTGCTSSPTTSPSVERPRAGSVFGRFDDQPTTGIGRGERNHALRIDPA